MKRNEIVESLLKEGFSEKTLVKFTDRQLSELAVRLMGEADIMISKKDPNVNQKIEDAKKQNKSIETYEQESEAPSSELNKKKKGENVKVKEWVESIAEENFHSFTSKNEIMEMIQFKLKEGVGSNVKTGHNGVPEFMSYDEISNSENAAPLTKPAPTKPKTSPTIKPKTPYQPGPGKNPKPKALKETI
jgi:DNA primase catalytic subunit